MIKAIIFDLDGVLIKAKKIHYDCLNLALCEIGEQYTIEWKEHLTVFDGLKTNQKLELLTKIKGLPKIFYEKIWKKKQTLTLSAIKNIKPNKDIENCIRKLSSDGYKIICCSNSIKDTVYTALNTLKIFKYFDLILSNEDVKNSKPHSEIYWKAISILGVYPDEVLIIEDSPCGLLSASKSCSNIHRVNSPSYVTYEEIKKKILTIETKNNMNIPKWVDDKLNILIPMSGAGIRFQEAGYTQPKPLIEIEKMPMIKIVVDNLNISANYIFVVQKSHRIKYNLDVILNIIAPNCKIVEVNGITEGAACSALIAKNYINNNSPLLIANSDQYVEWNSNEFMYNMNETNVDGGIVTFESTNPKWSFVKTSENNRIIEVAEKNPISNKATVGFYYWKYGSDFVKYAEQMIKKNLKINNEFYICPVFNEAIKDNKEIIAYDVEKMWGLGTPQDLNDFLNKKNI